MKFPLHRSISIAYDLALSLSPFLRLSLLDHIFFLLQSYLWSLLLLSSVLIESATKSPSSSAVNSVDTDSHFADSR